MNDNEKTNIFFFFFFFYNHFWQRVDTLEEISELKLFFNSKLLI